MNIWTVVGVLALLEYHTWAGEDRQIDDVVRLIECPACGEELEPEQGVGKVSYHIAEHSPEDFGLSPIGEVDHSKQGPLFPAILVTDTEVKEIEEASDIEFQEFGEEARLQESERSSEVSS